MPARGSDEYWAKFDTMTPEQRYQVEREWHDVESGTAEAPKPPDPNAPAPTDDKAKALPGDAPAAAEELFLEESWLGTLPEREQKTIRAMQASLDQFQPMMTPEFQEGMDRMVKDPIIKQRMDEIAGGNLWEPGDLAKEFNPAAYVKPEELEKLDAVSDPEGYKAYHENLVKQAYTDGLKKGSFATKYEMQQEVAFAEKKSKFDLGFGKLAEAHPELKAQDSTVKEFSDPKHPIFPFLKWASVNYRDDFFLKNENGFEAAYAGFLASGGQLNKAIASHVQAANMKFIRAVNDASKTAATVGRNSSAQTPQAKALIDGVDTDRYLSDGNYARQVFDRADQPTRQKLEKLRYGTLQPA